MSVPKNLIKVKTAQKGEIVYKLTNAPFSGSYYELNNKLYEGNSFRFGTPELAAVANANQLYNDNNTFVYSYISGETSQTLTEPKINIIAEDVSTTKNENFLYFFYTQVNIQPSFVRQIDEQTYLSLRNKPMYKTTFIGTYEGITRTKEEADKQVPGSAYMVESLAGDAARNYINPNI